jgi:hypothetical protein
MRAALAAATGLILAGCSTASSPLPSGPATSGVAATSGAGPAPAPRFVPAAALPFPVGVGNTWVYSAIVPSVGSAGTVTDKILSVKAVAGGNRVAESYTNSLSSTTVRTAYIFHSDGSVTLPLNQVSGGTLTSSYGGILLPNAAVIDSGQPYRYTMKIGFTLAGQRLTATAHVTVRGAGTATAAVPAGSYVATVIDVTIAWAVGTVAVTFEIKDWFAIGTGTVKSEALIREAGLSEIASTEALESFTRG